MMSQKLLIFSFFFLMGVLAHAQAENFYGVPQSLAANPGQSIQGAGIVPLSQGCQWGTPQAAATIDDDEDVKLAKADVLEAKKLKTEAGKAWKDASRLLNAKKREIARAMNGTNIDLVAEVTKCSSVWAEPLYRGALNSPEGAKYFNERYPAYANSQKKDNFDKADDTGIFPAGVAEGARCHKAHVASQSSNSKDLEAKALCFSLDGISTERTYKSGAIAPDKVAACQNAVDGLAKAIRTEAEAKVEFDKVKADYEAAAKTLKTTRADRKKEIADEKRFNKENGITADDDEDAGDGGVRGCTTGNCTVRVVERKKSTLETWMPLIQTALAVGVPAWVNVTNAKRNANLGYPTGPSPWLPSAFQLAGMAQNPYMYGYPMSYGGTYGGVAGGVGAGGFGCGQTIGGAGGFPNQPIYNNAGGGIFTPGYFPGYGYAGVGGGNGFPGGFMPQGFGTPFPGGPGAYNLYGGAGGGYPGALFGANAGASVGFNPYGGFQLGAGAYAGAGAGFGNQYSLLGGQQFGGGWGAPGWGGSAYGGFGSGYGGNPYAAQDDAQRQLMARNLWNQGNQLQYQGLNTVYGGSSTALPIGGAPGAPQYNLTSPTPYYGR